MEHHDWRNIFRDETMPYYLARHKDRVDSGEYQNDVCAELSSMMIAEYFAEDDAKALAVERNCL